MIIASTATSLYYYSDERLFQGVSCSFPTAVSTGELPASSPLSSLGKLVERRSLPHKKEKSAGGLNLKIIGLKT